MPPASRRPAESRGYKITVVGDGNIGKTCLLISYTKNQFPTDYVPTVFDTHRTSIRVDGIDHTVTLWDTAGQEEYDKLRYLTYPKTDCFIICYSIEKPSSFENVFQKWYPELRRHCPKAAMILIGTMSDLRSPTVTTVSTKEASKLRKRIKAYSSVQCSARTRENLDQVFVDAVKAIISPRKNYCLIV